MSQPISVQDRNHLQELSIQTSRFAKKRAKQPYQYLDTHLLVFLFFAERGALAKKNRGKTCGRGADVVTLL